MTPADRPREHLIEMYRKKAKHYDITSRLYPVPGYPVRAQRPCEHGLSAPPLGLALNHARCR